VTGVEELAAARAAYARRDWTEALAAYRAAGPAATHTADDAEALADAAWWCGDVDASLAAYEQAHQRHLDTGDHRRAAMAALGLGYNLMLRADSAQGSAWVGRAQRLLRDLPESPEHGYLAYIDVEAALGQGDAEAALAASRRVQAMGDRHSDPTLVAVGLVGEGRALVRTGAVADGMALMDQAMLTALSGRLDPSWAGNIYCHLMAACHELGDLRRAGEWVRATERWLDGLASAVLFSGICRVHRAQVLHVGGEWDRAEREVRRVCADLDGFSVTTVAEAHYETGSILTSRGDLSGAEEAFRQAHRLGRDPQPGLAMLRLAQGRGPAAEASIRVALATVAAGNPLARAPLLRAQVPIALAGGDVETARAACAELGDLAARFTSSGLDVAARQARGALLLAEDRPEEALGTLRSACGLWQELQAPYECARVRVVLARAYRALGDEDAAARELDAAAPVFERLGAVLDSREVARLRGGRRLPDGLTGREAQVLGLVSAGLSNQEVAEALVLSRKTVARHLSNIYTKLGLTSRTAAAAYAYEHGLASPAPDRG
jgi:ATP/maltotriose-dependent transcriptional regulator MalT